MLDLIYPRVCAGCRDVMVQPGYLCWDCLCLSEKVTRPFCERCGDPVDGLVEGSYVCTWCLKNKPAFDSARSVFRYGGPAGNLVQELKYRGGVHMVNEMAEYMAGAVRSVFAPVRFDLVAGVPLYPRRQRERGYNQAGLIADAVGRKLGLESFNRGVRRIRDTVSQTELKASRRSSNVKGAFAVADEGWIFGKHILLVDDVMTTGATVGEVSRVIKQAGAASVRILTFARG